MSEISEKVIEEVRSRTNIVDVISSRITLKRAGASFKACCPFHKEKTPSFVVNPSTESYKCFGCGEGGDVFSFLMKYDGMSFVDAVKALGDKCGIEIEFNEDNQSAVLSKRLFALHTDISDFFRRCLLQMNSGAAQAARDYLKRRELPDAICEEFGIGYDPDARGTIEKFAEQKHYTMSEMNAAGIALPNETQRGGSNWYDRFHGRLMFPIRDVRGRVVAFSGRFLEASKEIAKYVNSPETVIFKKSRVLYGLDKARPHIVTAPHREAIICEGQIDVIRCHACGFNRAVASQGTAFTSDHAVLLRRYADSAVLVFDQDSAGRKAAISTARVLLAEGVPVRIARLEMGEDPDSFLIKNSTEMFQKVLDDAIGIIDFQMEFLKETEQNPSSEGAAGRIAHAMLETVAAAKNEIHRARMMQEISASLNIPITALESELVGINEAIAKREESISQRANARMEKSSDVFANDESRNRKSGFEDEYFQIVDDYSETLGAGVTEKGGKVALPEKLDIAICEFLVHNHEEGAETIDYMRRFLPVWIIPNEMCRDVISAFFHAVETGEDRVVELQESNATIAEFIGTLAVSANKTGVGESFSAIDIAKELVLKAWGRWCHQRRATHVPKEGEEDSPENISLRAALTLKLKELRSWDTGERVIAELMETEKETV